MGWGLGFVVTVLVIAAWGLVTAWHVLILNGSFDDE